MALFHSPLGLAQRVSKPDTRLDALPLVTVLLLAGMLSLAGSRFLFSPGLTVELNARTATGETGGKNAPATLSLPRSISGKLPGIATGSTMTVLSAKSGNMFILDGRIYSLDENLHNALSAAAKRSPVLLLKPDKSVPMQTFFTLSEFAVKAGFEKIQIAGEAASKQ